MLMTAIWEGNLEVTRAALDKQNIKPETLTAALALASSDVNKGEITELLKQAGAVAPYDVDNETLKSYVGKYRNAEGFEINITFKEGKLFAAPGAQRPLSLLAVDKWTFRPIAFDDYGTLSFIIEAGNTVGCVLQRGSEQTQLTRL